MRLILMCCISLRLCSRIEGQFCNSQENCRQLEFRPDHTFNGKRLKKHMILSDDVISGDFCEMNCYMEANCVSYNLKRVADHHGRYKCELNNSTFEGQENKLETNSEYIYRGGKNACLKKPCKNGATCQTGFTSKGYLCLCTAGFRGSHCKKDIDECAKGNHNCDANAFCNNTKVSYNCTCNPGYYGDGRNCKQFKVSSCKEIYDKKISIESKAHPLIVENEVVDVYCHMTTNSTGNGACGDGGWTLVMKINGSKSTFHYDSKFWSNKETFDLTAGQAGFDTFETKLPTYWNTSFSKICLGMKVDGHHNFVVLDTSATSLYSLIADGQYRDTSLDRNTWKKLIGSQASLQLKCNKQGFNARCYDHKHSKARIGILGNDWNSCFLCDSRIGFGTGGSPDDKNTCGNEAENYGDNGDKHISAMGYIFVQ